MNDGIYGFDGEYRWLSNFYQLQYPIEIFDTKFYTTENLYQAFKCKHMDDILYIAQLSPGQAKRIGKKVEICPFFLETKLDVMTSILRLKFNQPKFKELLLATGDCYIEETNNWGDIFFGVCNGIGENHLGKIIMLIRDELNDD